MKDMPVFETPVTASIKYNLNRSFQVSKKPYASYALGKSTKIELNVFTMNYPSYVNCSLQFKNFQPILSNYLLPLMLLHGD